MIVLVCCWFLQLPCTAPQYTEESDLEAINEKFKKNVVWGSFGKAITKIEGVEDNASLSLGDRECPGVIPNPKVGLIMFPFDKNLLLFWKLWSMWFLALLKIVRTWMDLIFLPFLADWIQERWLFWYNFLQLFDWWIKEWTKSFLWENETGYWGQQTH